MNRTIRLPMWADIEMEVSLYEFYYELKEKTYRKGYVDPFYEQRMKDVQKLHMYLFNKPII